MSDGSADRKGKMRALDILSKHLRGKNSDKTTPTRYGHKSVELESILRKDNIVSSPLESRDHQESQRINNPHSNTASPTPKRRKLNTQAISSDNKTKQVLSIGELSHPDMQSTPARNRIMKKDIGDQNMSSSEIYSPSVNKSVSFLDESNKNSESTSSNSSPRHSPTSKPKKSILRNSSSPEHNKQRMNDKYGKPIAANVNLSRSENHSKNQYSPDNLQFWGNGEIHSLSSNNSIAEFEKLFLGALKILMQSKNPEYGAKKFEVYATINNIMPSFSSTTSNQFIEKAAHIVKDNLKIIANISIEHLRDEQNSLLQDKEKKNPFSIRLYIQIVRFFTNLFGSFIINKFLISSKALCERMKQVYELSLEALKNENSNKMMLICQMTFLRDEKLSYISFTEDEGKHMIQIINQIRDIPSTNAICEKLMLIKQFLIKFPGPMISTIPEWLPTQVISKIVFSEDVYSTKTGFTAISVLLELLKRCIDHSIGHEYVFQCLHIDSTALYFGDSKDKKLQWSNNTLEQTYDINETHLAAILRDHIDYLVNSKREYKLAMDMWLSFMGLLFNSKGRLAFLASKEGEKWVDINLNCLSVNDPKCRILSLKVWRILIYCVTNNIDFLGEKEAKKISQVLLNPVNVTVNELEDNSTFMGVKYLLNDFFFSTCGIANKCKPTTNIVLWGNFIFPMLATLLNYSANEDVKFELDTYIGKLLTKAIQNQKNVDKTKSLHPIKVIASEGVSVDDISALQLSQLPYLLETLGSVILLYVLNSKSQNHSQTRMLILEYLEQIPNNQITLSTLCRCISMFYEYYNSIDFIANSPRSLISDMSRVCIKFKDIIFDDNYNVFRNFILSFLMLFQEEEHHVDNLLQELIQNALQANISELKLIEGILSLKKTDCDLFAINWVGKKLLSPSVQEGDFILYSRIVAKISEKQTIVNFLDLADKLGFEVNPTEILRISFWKPSGLVIFLEEYIAKHHVDFADIVSSIIDADRLNNVELFSYVLKHLPENQKSAFIKQHYAKCPLIWNQGVLIDDYDLIDITLDCEICTFIAHHFSFLSTSSKAKLLIIFIEKDMYDLLVQFRYNLIQEFLPTLTIYKKDDIITTVQQHLINYCFAKNSFVLLDCIEPSTLTSRTLEDVIKLLEKSYEDNITFVPAKYIIFIDNLPMDTKINTTEILRVYLVTGDVTQCLFFLTSLINDKKMVPLTRCRNEVFDFFIALDSSNDLSIKAKAVTTFESLINVIFLLRKKVDIGFLSQYIARLPERPSRYLVDLSEKLILNKSFNRSKFRNSSSFNDLHTHVRTWCNQLDNTSGSTRETTPISAAHINDHINKNALSLEKDKDNLTNNTEQQKNIPNSKSQEISKFSSNIADANDLPSNTRESNCDGSQSTELAGGKMIKIDKGQISADMKNNKIAPRQISSIASEPDTLVNSNIDNKSMIEKGKNGDKTVNNNATTNDFEYRTSEDPIVSVNIPIFNSRVSGLDKLNNQKISDEYVISSHDLELARNGLQNQAQLHDMHQGYKKKSANLLTQHNMRPPFEDVAIPTHKELKIPIFNSLILKSTNQQPMLPNSQRKVQSEVAIRKRPLGNPSTQGQYTDIENERVRDYDDSQSLEDSADIRLHFPNKRARRIVSKLRGFSEYDMGQLSAEEKRNLRIELLDFLMKIEYHTITD